MEQDRKGAEGKLQQLVGNGILGCCKVALPHLVCQGGVLEYKLALSAMELVFQNVAGQLCSSCRAGIFGSPCSILPFLVPGIMLGRESWLCFPCPLHSRVQGI